MLPLQGHVGRVWKTEEIYLACFSRCTAACPVLPTIALIAENARMVIPVKCKHYDAQSVRDGDTANDEAMPTS